MRGQNKILQSILNVGGPKEVLLLFQAYSCLILLVVNPPVSLSCQHNPPSSRMLSGDTSEQLRGLTWSRDAVEKVCSRTDDHDNIFHKLILCVIGFAVTVNVRMRNNPYKTTRSSANSNSGT